MKIQPFFILLILLLASACRTHPTVLNDQPAPHGESLTVSAAVSLKDAFHEIGELYKSKTGRAVSFNFGASGALQRQIENGAPVDVFGSAGEKQMNELAARDLIDRSTRRDFARNTLVLIVPADTKMSLSGFSDLAKPEVQKIAVGNPKTVPAGEYSEQLFVKLNLKNSVQPKLILAEDVRQVLDYVVRGETDAGIVYATDAHMAGDKIRVAAVASEVDHAPILYPIAVVKESGQQGAAREFLELVTGAEGQMILQKYGFAVPVSQK